MPSIKSVHVSYAEMRAIANKIAQKLQEGHAVVPVGEGMWESEYSIPEHTLTTIIAAQLDEYFGLTRS